MHHGHLHELVNPQGHSCALSSNLDHIDVIITQLLAGHNILQLYQQDPHSEQEELHTIFFNVQSQFSHDNWCLELNFAKSGLC